VFCSATAAASVRQKLLACCVGGLEQNDSPRPCVLHAIVVYILSILGMIKYYPMSMDYLIWI
jgi:hypothetical protein